MTRWATQIVFSVLAGAIAGAIFYFSRASRRTIAIGAPVSAVLTLILSVWLAGSTSPLVLKIVSPADRAEVEFRTLVKGEVSSNRSQVYVIVHPILGDRWWVQSAPVVQNNGQWQTEVYLGTDKLGVGESFEILAVAATDDRWLARPQGNHLVEGQQLEKIPNDLAKSNLIVVKRGR